MDTPPQDRPYRALVLAPGVHVDPAALRFVASRSRGPGGQAVNKVSSAVQLRVWLADLQGLTGAALQRLRRLAGRRITDDEELLIRSDVHRSQRRNRQECLERLADLVERAVRVPRPRRRRRPTAAMIERRLRDKRRRSEKKEQRRKSGGEAW